MRIGGVCIFTKLMTDAFRVSSVKKLLQTRMASNSLIAIIDQFLGLFLTLFITSILARSFGPAELGTYTLALTLTSLVSVITNFGIQAAIKRDVAIDRSLTGFLIGQSILIRSLLSLPLSVGIVHLLAIAMNYSADILMICHSINLFVFASGVYALASGVLISLHLNKSLMIFNVSYRVSIIACLTLIIYFEKSLQTYIMCLFVITLCICACSINKILVETQPAQYTPDWKYIRQLLVISAPLTLAATTEFANLKIDSLILGYYHPSEEIGYYAAAFNVFLAFTMLPLAVTKVFFPNFIDTFHNDSKHQAICLLTKISLMFFVYGIMATILIYFLSEILVLIFYGNGFERTTSVLTVLGIGIPLIVLNRLSNYVLIALRRDKDFFYVTLAGLVANLALNFILIPDYSIHGAAIATVASEGMVMVLSGILMIISLRRRLHQR